MRKSRLTERRKRELKKSLILKPLVGVYLMFLFLSSITGSTEAAFNDVEGLSASLKVGWEIDEDEKWDKSSLSFDGMEVGGNCDRIYAYVKNGGDGDMEVPWSYQVIKISQGNDEDVIHEGETPLIDSSETAELAYEGELENGKYKFKFVRPEGHPSGDSGGFSSEITLTNCEEQGNEEDDDQGGPPDKCSDDFPGNPPRECEDQEQPNDNEKSIGEKSVDEESKEVEEKETNETQENEQKSETESEEETLESNEQETKNTEEENSENDTESKTEENNDSEDGNNESEGN
ncbi:amyloid fiber anchoring/assembly protein TapA [Aquisalibacillus elongatus]|uniref:YqxM protein n=1 Tax=Aquisalibacillus elongatus TaxID=485577 RepID=A0A3N5C6T5_9BACI|nr:amyloid fiber anchoring/assembly protein TapA [Aquisalibacillus elongatus]RPF54025.1 YqxM protein [Aquisalibacillus elongatus]